MLTLASLIKTLCRSAVFLLALIGLASCNFISNRILTKPVVRIDGAQLSAQELSVQLADRLKSFDALSAKDPKIVGFFKQQIINEFIVKTLVSTWCEQNGISVSKDELAAELKKTISTYPSDSDFRELLADSGQGYGEWASSIEFNLKKRKLIETLKKGSDKLNESELLSYYNNNRLKYEQPEAALLAHIQVEDLNQADIVKKLLVRGSFSDVAQKYSKAYNEESKDRYGWVERSYAGELEAAFKLRVGEVFGPITLSDGSHIFKILERRSHKTKTFSEMRPQVLAEVMALRETALFSSWLDVQIKKSNVKKNLSVIDSIRVETR